jgi:hypothetical protein
VATAVAKTEVVAVSVELTLTAAEAKTLVEYLNCMGKAPTFRVANPKLYHVQNVLEDALR